DNCITTLTLPFDARLYDDNYSTAQISSNGLVTFFGQPDLSADNVCLPNTPDDDTIYAYWDDLTTATDDCADCGIYTDLNGSAPNRTFVIEWRACASGLCNGSYA